VSRFSVNQSFATRSADDFKPASVDRSQEGHVEVADNNEVTITLPQQQGSKGVVYKGPKKPAVKECVLIYDPQTRSLVLERITSQIQVKQTRYKQLLSKQCI